MSTGNNHQDWAPVTIHGKATPAHPSSARPSPGQNPEAARLRKLEEAEAPRRPKTLTLESVAAIQAYRREHKKDQKAFDGLFSWPANTTKHLESRHVAPTPGQLQAMNALLKTKLTVD